jgi:hypothetical protein
MNYPTASYHGVRVKIQEFLPAKYRIDSIEIPASDRQNIATEELVPGRNRQKEERRKKGGT